MRRGFKSECESLAAAVRAELGLDTRAVLKPRDIAAHLNIPVHPVSCLRGIAPEIAHVTSEARHVLSALTIFPDWPQQHRLIIFNDANAPERQTSDIAHELSHGLLMHEPRNAIVGGCRDYVKQEEDEAAWLSGCLLVPRDAAFSVAMAGRPLQDAAAEYGVSLDMMRMRLNVTGATKVALRTRGRRSA